MRMCPQMQSKCGKKNSHVFNKAGETVNTNITLNPGDVCVYNLRAKCGIPTLEFETDQDWSNVDILTIDFDDKDLESTDFSVKPSANSVAVPSANVSLTYYGPYYFYEKMNFTSGVSKDNIEYNSASFSPDYLEVSFNNGTIHYYRSSSLNLYWTWYFDYYYNLSKSPNTASSSL